MRRIRISGQKYCFILDDGNKTLDCGNDRHNLFFIVTMTPDRLFKTEIKQKRKGGQTNERGYQEHGRHRGYGSFRGIPAGRDCRDERLQLQLQLLLLRFYQLHQLRQKDAFKTMEDIEVMEVSEASLLGETAATSGSSACGSCSCCGSTSCISCGMNDSSANATVQASK